MSWIQRVRRPKYKRLRSPSSEHLLEDASESNLITPVAIEEISTPRTEQELKLGRHPVRPRTSWWVSGKSDYSHVSVDDEFEGSSTKLVDGHDVNTSDASNVFSDSDARDLYKPVLGYEGSHRFDHNARWTEEQEKALVRKLDWRIALPVCIMFFALQLDRGNIVQAVADNMLDDLNLSTNDYNNGQTIFYVSFLLAEIPSQLISKRLGPDVWIPIQMVAWSIVAASQAALADRTGFYICRSLLGLIEGGFIPDVILYLSYYYKNSELPQRLGWFWTSAQATTIVGAFLAYAILQLRSDTGLKQGWRYLYAIEGSLTSLIGIFTWLYLPASPTETRREGIKGLLRPKTGWFTEQEEVILVTRILRDDPSKATMHNRQGLSARLLWDSLLDYDLWPIYLIGLSWQVPMIPVSQYLTLTIKSLGFSTLQTTLLTIPAGVLFICQLLFYTWFSERINQRLLIGIIAQFWVLPFLIVLEILPPSFNGSQWIKWAITSLIVGYPYAHAVIVALVSRNSGSVRTRTVGSSLYNMSVQTASIIGSQVYRADDGPNYYRGNRVLLGVIAYNVLLFIAAKVYYTSKNRRRDEVWWSMSREERLRYLATTEETGNKRLDFRFAS